MVSGWISPFRTRSAWSRMCVSSDSEVSVAMSRVTS